ncbi:MAG: PIN domain-containing protein [Sulfolobus sp.]|nr:PIN domain-containing protein [Sulfolobus sp.]
MEAVVDTNVIVSIIVEDDIHHEKRPKVWNSLSVAYVPTIVLFEFSYFLLKHKVGLYPLEELIFDEKVKIVESTKDDIYFAMKHNPVTYDDFNDLIILSVARRLGVELITFDKDLEKLSKTL